MEIDFRFNDEQLSLRMISLFRRSKSANTADLDLVPIYAELVDRVMKSPHYSYRIYDLADKEEAVASIIRYMCKTTHNNFNEHKHRLGGPVKYCYRVIHAYFQNLMYGSTTQSYQSLNRLARQYPMQPAQKPPAIIIDYITTLSPAKRDPSTDQNLTMVMAKMRAKPVKDMFTISPKHDTIIS